MNTRSWFGFLLPVGLILFAGAVIIRASVVETDSFLLEYFDSIIALFGLSLTAFATLILIVREIAVRTHQLSIRQTREEALTEHRRFLRRLDHELKNPLTALRAGLSALAFTDLSPSQRQIVETIEPKVLGLSHLVTDLRKLAEIETVPLEAQSIVVADFVEEILELYQKRVLSQQRALKVDLVKDYERLPPLIGDPNLLLLAVHNLLDNALKYSRPGDTIILGVGANEKDLMISVGDTGTGIADADLPLVWEELYRGQGTSGIPGSGIGLALVKAIVERHYGTASLHSTSDSGTVVTLQLPLK